MKKFSDIFVNNSGKLRVNRLSSAHIFAFGYLVIILLGTFLLMLPVSSKDASPCFLDAMFTAASATCVTGLAVFDTYTQWSFFGQVVIIMLIQVGGLGFMTIISLAALATGRKIGLKERSVLQDSVNGLQLAGIVRMAKRLALGTFIFEGIGAVLLAVRFVPKMGAPEGIGNAVFMSVSAFCNAGFDLNGKYGEYSSLCEFADDPLVCITVCLLVLIGGIGFSVWDDIGKNKLNFSAYRLHSKLALVFTVGLTVVGTGLFFLFERNHTNAGAGVGQALLNSFFDSVTPRTAGFNTVDTAALSPASTILTIIFMFIGGSPGSTAGGVKTVTVFVLFLAAFSSMKNSEDINIFGRRLEEDITAKALTVITVNLFIVFSGILCICAAQPELALKDVFFEGFSAINTVGMTTGITRELVPFSRIVIILLMYCGRVGSVSFALIFTGTKKFTGVHNPVEQVNVG
ncbi:MAG: Trk family potassium uptake protein [Oscillospiraceae bacterium]|nr:Trk family potassium uptake protein [Oscillospiraceae bacterium]